jgi:hypothetical protein
MKSLGLSIRLLTTRLHPTLGHVIQAYDPTEIAKGVPMMIAARGQSLHVAIRADSGPSAASSLARIPPVFRASRLLASGPNPLRMARSDFVHGLLGRALLPVSLAVMLGCSFNAVSDSPTGPGGSNGEAGSGGQAGEPGTAGTGGSHGSGGTAATGGETGNLGVGGAGQGGSVTGGSGGGGEPAGGGASGRGGTGGSGGGHTGTGGSQGSGGVAGRTGGLGSGGSSGGTSGGHGGSSSNGTGGAAGAGGAADAGTKSDGSTSAVSYAKDIQPLLTANCATSGCHGASNPQAGIDLTSYAKVKPNATTVNSVIQRGMMPPSGALSAANKKLFQAWIDAGTPNN